MVKKVAAVKVGDVEIYATVVVIIGCRDPFRESDFPDAGSHGNVLKGAISPIEKELARPVLVADKEVEETVVVDVRPSCRLRPRGRFRQSSLTRNVRECSVAIVPQKRFAQGKFPRASQNENVHTPVVVVIRLNHVEASELIGETRMHFAVSERAVTIIRSEEHTSELQSPDHLVCRLLLEKKKRQKEQA